MDAAFLFATKGGIREMAVFRVEKNSGYTVMSNHHLRNRALSLKAKGLLSQMLSLPEDWDYTLQGWPVSTGKALTRYGRPSGTGTGRIHPAFQRTGRERAAARCRLCDLRAAAACSCIGFTYIGKSNVGESHAGKPYVGKSNAIK